MCKYFLEMYQNTESIEIGDLELSLNLAYSANLIRLPMQHLKQDVPCSWEAILRWTLIHYSISWLPEWINTNVGPQKYPTRDVGGQPWCTEYLVSALKWRELVWMRTEEWGVGVDKHSAEEPITDREQHSGSKSVFWGHGWSPGTIHYPWQLISCFWLIYVCSVLMCGFLRTTVWPLTVWKHRNLHEYISKHMWH